jgi:hypothetical protein
MKKILSLVLLACAFSLAACPRSDKQPDTTQTTPADLKSDAERLQNATAKAAADKKRSEPSSPTASAPQP